MSARGSAESYRRKSLLESVAHALPAGGAFDRLRGRLRASYERALGWQGGLHATLPGGETVRVAPDHRHMTWNPEEYAAFRESVRSGQTVIDAGANVGCYAILFGQWVGATGRVYAFEPDPRAFDGLMCHIELNALQDVVVPIRTAIADRSQPSVPFERSESSGVSRLASASPFADTGTINVRATTIDDFCAEHGIHPDVIKIDVEGGELEALQGARRTLESTRLQHLFVELHPSIWKSMGIGAADVERECERLGLTAERLDGAPEDPWTIEGVCVRLCRSAP